MNWDHCINCGEADAELRDLLVRNNRHRAIALCETCHESIERELDRP